MPEAKGIEALTDWITYELQPTDLIIGEPKIAFRLRFLDKIDVTDAVSRRDWNYIQAVRDMAMTAVAEWDLTAPGGKPIPVNDETKQRYLFRLLAEPLIATEEQRALAAERSKVAGVDIEPTGTSLAAAVARDAQKRSLFLKN
jgi:hypothetical protein